ncbi:beta-ketoacyl-[acyl-carrier-protein] synthase family protein [Goodfellowiella coeruleoviolacea]|uniref:3-oxoacyl-[acyl-carrier-protein] synthase II n=1 Tax=Goodfellowiella coeruleoviolacea TaxID=334858 RepID=A0AAE3KD55_9PSEU|nr:beta-ketoacyl-[acyl-carrier-protein] synthase family protein [Goodfellowiella coeruleoviolacea]MCP2163656.1 3-oxoacyl-[acyl-carrier-protein] synthase II [Goodfellowiella coeruleoviolacea]
MRRDVLVTGFGVHTVFGRGVEALRRGVFAGTPAFAPATRFDTRPYRTPFAAQGPGDPRLAEVLADCAEDALAAAGLAAGSAADVLLGCAGDFTAVTRFWRGDRAASPVDSVPAHLAEGLAARFGLRGRHLAVTNACVASAHAIIQGCRLIATGRADTVLCAGAYLVEEENFAKFDSGRALARDGAVRPFAADRTGLLLGDGVAALVLESAEHARARGARPLARITGWGASSDAHHIAKPHPDGAGMAAAIRQALRGAGRDSAADPGGAADAEARPVDYVNAHGTGTPANDSAETRGLHAAFGAHAAAIPVSSTKSTTGHLLEASGAVEAVITLLALTDGVLPPTAGHTTPDPACDLDYVTAGPRPAPVRRALSLNAAFGGMNTAILLERP